METFYFADQNQGSFPIENFNMVSTQVVDSPPSYPHSSAQNGFHQETPPPTYDEWLKITWKLKF